MGTKYGEFAIAERIRVSPVMYIAIPGTLRIKLAVDPRHKPRKPSEAAISLATLMTETRLEILGVNEHVAVLSMVMLYLERKGSSF